MIYYIMNHAGPLEMSIMYVYKMKLKVKTIPVPFLTYKF